MKLEMKRGVAWDIKGMIVSLAYFSACSNIFDNLSGRNWTVVIITFRGFVGFSSILSFLFRFFASLGLLAGTQFDSVM